MIALNDLNLIAIPIIRGHDGKVIMCSGFCDALPGVLVCTFSHIDDALKAAKSIKVDWEAVSVFEDFDIKLHDALFGRRRTYKEKMSDKCGSGQSTTRNTVADLEIVLCQGDLWHFGGHGLFGQEISIAYNLLKERCKEAAMKEKNPELMVKEHSIYATNKIW